MNRRDLLAVIAKQRKAIAGTEARLAEERARLDVLERDLATTQPEIRDAVIEPLRFPAASITTTASSSARRRAGEAFRKAAYSRR